MPNELITPKETARGFCGAVREAAKQMAADCGVTEQQALELITYRIQCDLGGFPRDPKEEERLLRPFTTANTEHAPPLRAKRDG